MVGTKAILAPSDLSAVTAARNVSMSRTICTLLPPPISAWRTPLRGADGIIKAKKTQGVQMASPHFIVFANEKGGTGKSTTAVHSAVALAAAGRKVAALDLDTRQRTLGRYLDNRAETVKRLGIDLVMPAYETFDPDKSEADEAQLDRIGADVESEIG